MTLKVGQTVTIHGSEYVCTKIEVFERSEIATHNTEIWRAENLDLPTVQKINCQILSKWKHGDTIHMEGEVITLQKPDLTEALTVYNYFRARLEDKRSVESEHFLSETIRSSSGQVTEGTNKTTDPQNTGSDSV